MLIKEYRIPLPLSITEFEIADLYTIQVKSLKIEFHTNHLRAMTIYILINTH